MLELQVPLLAAKALILLLLFALNENGADKFWGARAPRPLFSSPRPKAFVVSRGTRDTAGEAPTLPIYHFAFQA